GFKGGVHVCQSPEEAREIAAKMLGQTLVTHQTGPAGRVVNKVLVAESADIGREIYFAILRSEEHTSELQSRFDIVCRLLHEKKKFRCCHLKNIWTAPLPPETELSRQMTTSTTSIDIMGLQAAYANLHTDQERDYFMQRYHDVISSFGGKTSYDADNRPFFFLLFHLRPSSTLFPYTTLFR